MQGNKEFDIVIFGATGYTGRYVTEELAKTLYFTIDMKWAVAGRNVEKLKESLDIVQKFLPNGISMKETAIIKADVEDSLSISDMCRRAKVILNCVGPYKFYGEKVVAACIENGTHHVDLSGEIKYLETVQANYFNAAREKEVYVVQACGFNSIPADCGITLLKKKFPGDLNSVEYYIEIEQGRKWRSMNIGTFLSIINSVADTLNTKKFDNMLKDNIFSNELMKSKYSLSWRLPLFYSGVVTGWCFWFVGADDRVIKRSQMFRNDYLNERLIQSYGYFRVSALFTALFYLIFLSISAFMSLFSFGRYLLAKYPSIFTAGLFSRTGPTREQVEEGSTKVVFWAEGWDEKIASTDNHLSEPNKIMKLIMKGPEPIYALTAVCMVQAGLVILQENDKMPLEGGVLTPGVAFENTSLYERLEKRGMTFNFETVK